MESLTSDGIKDYKLEANFHIQLVLSDGYDVSSLFVLQRSFTQAFFKLNIKPFDLVILGNYRLRKLRIRGEELSNKIDDLQILNTQVREGLLAFSGEPDPDGPLVLDVGHPPTKFAGNPRLVTLESLGTSGSSSAIKVRVDTVNMPRRLRGNECTLLCTGTFADKTMSMRFHFFGDADNYFYKTIKVDKTYVVSEYNLLEPEATYNYLGSSVEIQLVDGQTVVIPVESDECWAPSLSFHFTSIGDINSQFENKLVDVKGSIIFVGDMRGVNNRGGSSTQVRNIKIIENFPGSSLQNTIRVSLWGDEADMVEECGRGSIIRIKNIRVLTYQTKTYLFSVECTRLVLS